MSSSSQNYREFNLDRAVARVRLNTVNLHDYRMVNDEVARVVVSYTGNPTPAELFHSMSGMFKGLASPVRNSFRKLTESSAVGFVCSNREVRQYDAADSTKYRVLASNMLMDNDDESLWSLHEGASGAYLTRKGNEDLSELVHASMHRRSGTPMLSSVLSAVVADREFVAFVNPVTASMDYGYVVDRGDESLAVLSVESKEVAKVDPQLVVHSAALMGSDEEVYGHRLVAAADKQSMVDYYTKAYGHAPEYLAKLIDLINQHAFA